MNMISRTRLREHPFMNTTSRTRSRRREVDPLTAAQRAVALITSVIVRHATLHALVQQFQDQVVDPQRRRDVIRRAGKLRGGFGGQPWNILRPMLAGPEEKRGDDDAGGAALDAARVRRRD